VLEWYVHSSTQQSCAYSRQASSVEEQLRMIKLQAEVFPLIRPFVSYFIVREKAHLTMASFMQPHPGLIHFILVDRTLSRLVAPSIPPVLGALEDNQGLSVIDAQQILSLTEAQARWKSLHNQVYMMN